MPFALEDVRVLDLTRLGYGAQATSILGALGAEVIRVESKTRPDSRHVTLGPTAQAITGLTYMVGLPGRRPAGWSFSYLDHMGGYLGAFGALCALRHRRKTGEGQHVDVSQIEPGIPLTGAAILDR